MAEWNCFTCKKQNNDAVCFRCKDGSEYIKQTNADRIRSMTDEELAEFLCEISMCKPDYCPAYLECMKTEYGTMTTWLQSEAE